MIDKPSTPRRQELKAIFGVARHVALAQGAHPSQADEIAQLTTIKIMKCWDYKSARQARNNNEPRRWGNYIATVALNTQRDLARSSERQTKREREFAGALEKPIEKRPNVQRHEAQDPSGIEQFLARRAIEDELEALPHYQRVCVELIYLEGFSVREAADALGVQPQTVRKHVRKGLAILRRRLEP